jgi:hypothetical protein
MKIGSASFRNCTRVQIEKSCPTFSSGDILRRVLSDHFLPALSRWMERSCVDLALPLSLFVFLAGQNVAEQSVATSAKANSRCRGMHMPLTIAKMSKTWGTRSADLPVECRASPPGYALALLKSAVRRLRWPPPESQRRRPARSATRHRVRDGTM